MATATNDALERRHPIRDPRFRRLWAGSTVSMCGDQFYLVALPWLVLHLTGSAVAMGTILMAAAVPRAVLMLMGGAFSDRVSPRRILMTTASARAVLVGAIGVLVGVGAIRLWHLYLLGFAFGIADAFAMPASQAFLPSLVGREDLVAANSLVQSTAQLTTIVGPAPAGLVIKAVGTVWAFAFDAVSFLFIPAALWTLADPARDPPASGRPPVWRSIDEGLRYVLRDVPLRTLVLLASAINFCLSGPIGVGLPYLTKTRFNSPTAFGVAVSAVAAGGLLGASLAGVWRVRHRGILILAVSSVLGFCLGSMGVLPSLPAIAAVLLVMGTCAGFANVQIMAWLQQRVEASVRGRVMSVLMLPGMGLLPVSLAVAGLLAAWSLPMLFVIAAATLLAVATVAALNRTVREIR